MLRAILYDLQWEIDKYFLHGHPTNVNSWEKQCIDAIFNKHRVVRVVGDQCMCGFVATDKRYTGSAGKNTKSMTNSQCIVARLNKKCLINKKYEIREHVKLENGRPKTAQIHPTTSRKQMCKIVCGGYGAIDVKDGGVGTTDMA